MKIQRGTRAQMASNSGCEQHEQASKDAGANKSAETPLLTALLSSILKVKSVYISQGEFDENDKRFMDRP